MLQTRLYAVRGATTCAEDTREHIVARTRVLLEQLLVRNRIDAANIISIMFTATDDLHSEFPAAAARAMGLTGVPMMCARELAVRDSPLTLHRCVRVMIHYYGDERPDPVYLEGAALLLERVQEEEARAGRIGSTWPGSGSPA